MKRVIILCPSLAIGGREKIAVNTARCLMNEYSITFVVYKRTETEYECPCPIINFNLQSKSNSKLSKALIQIIRIIKLFQLRWKIKADVVYSFGTAANVTNSISGLFSPGESFSAIHGFSSLNEVLENSIILHFSDRVICISKEMSNEYRKKYPSNKKIVTIENGYDFQSMNNETDDCVEMPDGKPVFLAMGRLERVKGYDRLLVAFKKVLYEIPNAILCFLGKGSQEIDLKKQANILGIDSHVFFLGNKEYPYAYLRKADVFVLSSYNEGFPNALIEALDCELPIVAVDCQSGPREILSSSSSENRIKGILYADYGVLVEDNSNIDVFEKLFSRAMIEIYNNKDLCVEYKAKSRERANCFSLKEYKRKLVSLIET